MILGEVSACCGLRNQTKQSFVPEHTAKRDTRKLRTCEVLHYYGFSMCSHLKNQVEAEEGWSDLCRNWPDFWQGARKAFESDYRLCGASVSLYVFVLAHMFLLVCVLVRMLLLVSVCAHAHASFGLCVCVCAHVLLLLDCQLFFLALKDASSSGQLPHLHKNLILSWMLFCLTRTSVR